MTIPGFTRRILFVCRGNICRSPMAMALTRHRLERAGLDGDVEVDSAGYYNWGPFVREAHPFARRAVQQLCGSDLLASTPTTRWWTPVLVVAEDWMRGDFPPGRTMTMRELGCEEGDVDDPYGGDLGVFLDCARQIDRLISTGWNQLVGDHSHS